MIFGKFYQDFSVLMIRRFFYFVYGWTLIMRKINHRDIGHRVAVFSYVLCALFVVFQNPNSTRY